MIRSLLTGVLCGLSTLVFAGEPMTQLPQPEYGRQPSDPPWLVQVVQFHGHLGPAVVAGARMGMTALRAVDAKGYFDVEVVCEGPLAKPPQSCFLDGLQLGTGATLGKRTLHWVEADRLVVKVKNLQTGRTAELHPTADLMELLASFKPRPRNLDLSNVDHKVADEHLEAIARRIASLPEKDIAEIKQTDPTASH